jgi:O-antigen ligase
MSCGRPASEYPGSERATDESACTAPTGGERPGTEPTGGARMSIARRISWGALLAMVFMVPLIMTDFALPGTQGRLAFSSLELVKLSLLRVLLLIALAAWAWDLLRKGGRIHHTPIDWLILAWLVWVAITTATSVHWPTALLGTYGRYEGLLTFVTYALVYFLLLQFADDATRVRRLSQTLFLTSVVVASYGLLQYVGLIFLPEDLPWLETNRAFATYGNPNMLGGFLIFSVTVALGLALQERRLAWRLVYWLGFGLSGLALFATFTRGAWIGAVLSLVLFGIMAWRQRTKLRRVDWVPAGVFGAAGIGLIVRSLSDPGEVMNFGKRITSIFQFDSGSGQTRTEIWRAAVAAIKERPLLGWGADTFGQVFSKFKPVEYVRDAGGASGADNAHDYPLHLASGIGILGALVFFVIWIWAGIRSWKTVFGRPGDSTRLLLGAFWAASAGYLLHLAFGLSVPGITLFLWIGLALVLAPTAHLLQVKARRWGTVTAAAIILLAGLGAAGQAVVLAADRAYETATEEFSPRPYAERAAAADQALALNPLVPEHWSAVAGLLSEQVITDAGALIRAREAEEDLAPYEKALAASCARAESAFEDAIAFTPRDYANYVNLARLYNSAGPVLGDDYYQSAVDIAQRGLEVMPFGTTIRLELAEALLATGKTEEAVEALEYCVQIDARDGLAALALAKIYQQQGKTAEALALLTSVNRAEPGQAGVAAAIRALEEGETLP